MTCGIYVIANTVSPLYYIGQSSHIERRWAQHRHLLNGSTGRRCNIKLRNSWRKYGVEAFTFTVLEECSIAQLTERETFWLAHYRDTLEFPLANSAGPADNPMRGQQHAPETLARISQVLKGMPKSVEHRARIGAAHRGRQKSADEKRAISLAKTGVPIPSMRGERNPSCRPENRARMTGKNNPAKRPEARAKMSRNNGSRRPVVDSATGEWWPTMSACAAALGVSVAAVHAAATKKNPTVKGHVLQRAAAKLAKAVA